MGDILDLSIKSFEGKVRTATGTLGSTVTGDLATITASGSKDMYLAKAQASIKNTGGLVDGDIEVVLKVNNTIVDRWFSNLSKNVNIGGNLGNKYNFAIGFKVTTGQIIKLEVIIAASNVGIAGSLEVFEEDTGVSPQIPSV